MISLRQHKDDEFLSMEKLSLYDNACMRYPYTLPPLAYAHGALEPHIDEQTMHVHHDEHHQAYIDGANRIVEKHPELQSRSLVELLADLDRLPAEVRKALKAPGGGHLNHTLFWEYLTPDGVGEPQGKLAQTIKRTFDGFTQFKEQFDHAAINWSGSGWTWLCVTPRSELQIYSTANQNTPLSSGRTPVLGLDVWEHAYYLKYQNKRTDYVANWWRVVNWQKVEEQFRAIIG